ncbi:MAG: hypothetical protein K0S32_1980 [Bacteroidetes bacterium]|jgi:hypothetical protein|nr:hypothetical protein [Bacteroidota bacterium]
MTLAIIQTITIFDGRPLETQPMRKNLDTVLIILFLSLSFYQLRSQDLIVKINGDSIKAKITEVGTESITYKKVSMPNGPSFTDLKKEIAFVRFANGEFQHYNKTSSVQTNSVPATTTSATSTPTSSTTSQGEKKNKIDILNSGRYYINDTPASQKEVNRLLSSSKNPAIVTLSKATIGMGKAQKIMKITSYPMTISGGFVSIITMAEAYQLVQRGRATPKAFVNMGLSLVGTAVFPITTKILKKKSDKMYAKIIDMYNVTN